MTSFMSKRFEQDPDVLNAPPWKESFVGPPPEPEEETSLNPLTFMAGQAKGLLGRAVVNTLAGVAEAGATVTQNVMDDMATLDSPKTVSRLHRAREEYNRAIMDDPAELDRLRFYQPADVAEASIAREQSRLEGVDAEAAKARTDRARRELEAASDKMEGIRSAYRKAGASAAAPFEAAGARIRELNETALLKRIWPKKEGDGSVGAFVENMKDPRWWSEDFAEGLGSMIANIIPGMAATKVGKVAGMTDKAARSLGFAVSSGVLTASETGNQYNEMKHDLILKGMDEAEAGILASRGALPYGIVAGLIERGILPVQFGAKWAKASGLKGFFMRALVGGAGEVTEEEAQMLLGGVARYAVGLDPNLSWQEALESAVMAGPGGGIMSAPRRGPFNTTTENQKRAETPPPPLAPQTKSTPTVSTATAPTAPTTTAKELTDAQLVDVANGDATIEGTTDEQAITELKRRNDLQQGGSDSVAVDGQGQKAALQAEEGQADARTTTVAEVEDGTRNDSPGLENVDRVESRGEPSLEELNAEANTAAEADRRSGITDGESPDQGAPPEVPGQPQTYRLARKPLVKSIIHASRNAPGISAANTLNDMIDMGTIEGGSMTFHTDRLDGLTKRQKADYKRRMNFSDLGSIEANDHSPQTQQIIDDAFDELSMKAEDKIAFYAERILENAPYVEPQTVLNAFIYIHHYTEEEFKRPRRITLNEKMGLPRKGRSRRKKDIEKRPQLAASSLKEGDTFTLFDQPFEVINITGTLLLRSNKIRADIPVDGLEAIPYDEGSFTNVEPDGSETIDDSSLPVANESIEIEEMDAPLDDAEPQQSAPTAKQAWQMTREEFREKVTREVNYAQAVGAKGPESYLPRSEEEWEFVRKGAIGQALYAGKPVPPEVLADYPDLKPAYTASQSGVQTDLLGQPFVDPATGAQQSLEFTTESEIDRDTRAMQERDDDPAQMTLGEGTTAPPPARPTITRSAGEPSPEDMSSSRNVDTARDREVLGLNVPDSPSRRSWQTALGQARAQGIPDRAVQVAAGVMESGRIMTDIETAGMTEAMRQWMNQHEHIHDLISKTSDAAEIKSLSAEAVAIERQFDAVSTAVRISGTETGRALAARKLTLDRSFNLVSVLSRAKASKGAELTAEERGRIESLTSQLQTMESRVSQLETQLKEEMSNTAINESLSKRYNRMTETAKEAEYSKLSTHLKTLLKAGCHNN